MNRVSPAAPALLLLVIIGSAAADEKAAPAQSTAEARLIGRLDGPAGTSLLFSPDGTLLASAGDERVQLWRVSDLKPLHPPLRHGAKVQTILFTRDGKRLLTVGGPQVCVWDAQGGKRISTLHVDGNACCAALTPDGNYIAVGTATAEKSGALELLDLATGKERLGLRHPAPVRFVIFSRDGAKILTVNQAWKAPLDKKDPQAGWPTDHVWDTRTGREIWYRHTDVVDNGPGMHPAEFSADMQTVAVIASHNVAGLTDAADGKGLVNQMTAGEENWLSSVRFSRDGKWLLMAGGYVMLWDTTNIETLIRKFVAGCDAVFSPGGSRILISSNRDESGVWDIATGDRILTIDGIVFNQPHCAVTAYSSDDRHVAAAFPETGFARVWELPPESATRVEAERGKE